MSVLLGLRASSQCGAGYTSSQINWDFLDYIVSTGSYSGFVTNAMAGTQNFMMGTTRVTIAAATPSFTLAGENASHTGELAGYTGQDVQYTPTVSGDSIVITFDQVVTGLQQKGIDLRRPYGRTTALFVARQVLLQTILVRIVKPQINSSNP